jgi:hypothetical protein
MNAFLRPGFGGLVSVPPEVRCFVRLFAAGFLALQVFGIPGAAGGQGDAPLDTPGNGNPLVPGYFADPTVKQFGDTFYLYATTDGNGGGRGPPVAWVSKDFVNWVLVPMNWPRTPHYWAPDVVQGPDDRYYLFYSQPCNIYCGVSDTPLGPWTPVTPGDGMVIPDRLIPEVITLDLQVFEDRDGTRYGYWGTWGIYPDSGCGIGVFNRDMMSFSRFAMIPNAQAIDFFEAPFMIERDGVYYFMYSSGSCHDASYRVQYAVGDRPDGEFQMGPNNPILASNGEGTVHGPGHHSILQRDDEYYIVYHRHDIPVTPNGMHRQICADPLVFERPGVIRVVEPTHRGIGYLGPPSRPADLALGRQVTASTYYRDTLRDHVYKPAHAVDANNATLWRPGDNRPGHWLQVDLGESCRVRHIETQFEYGTWAYQYVLEHSQDAQHWQVFADRRHNGRWGSPMVDRGDVEARYVRLTVTGTEYPGLFGAVWNIKVYADSPADPLLAIADRAFVHAERREVLAPVAARPAGLGSAPAEPMIHLDVADLHLGVPVDEWANRGSFGGLFRSDGVAPVVGIAAGRKAVHFTGQQMLTASFPAPRALAGNSSFTVATWINNPEIGESECFLSWAGRGGPDATTAQFGYGSHPAFGAVGHWGFADMGFRPAPPEAGVWHHLAVVFDGIVERIYVDGQLHHAAAKMLLMQEGRPIHIGASAPGTEHLDGFLASLRVYDRPLDEAAVRRLADDPPDADVLLHVDSGRMDYGPVRGWSNHGSLGGAFVPPGQPPEVADVDGRISVRFQSDRSLAWTAGAPIALHDWTLLAGVANLRVEAGENAVMELVDGGGRSFPLPPEPAADGWQEFAIVHRDGTVAHYRNGAPVDRPISQLPTTLTAVRLGGRPAFTGALTRVQLFNRALTADEIARLHRVWQREWQPPQPSPAAFDDPPRAASPTLAVMAARAGHSPLGGVEYLFRDTTAGPGGNESDWRSTPFYLVDGLRPDEQYAYTVVMRDPLGNVTAPAAPISFRTDQALFRFAADDFQTARDFLADGVAGTVWHGLVRDPDGNQPEAVRIQEGQLLLQSSGTVWDGGNPHGPFLFTRVAGDFVAEAHVAGYAGWDTRRVPGNNDGGLMARVPNPDDAGPGEDLVQLNFFPIWEQGNMVTHLDGGGRQQQGNRLAWNAHPHLQIIRHGSQFHFRTSADGEHWEEMPGSPLTREDMRGLPLQVGLFHASYGAESSFVSFDHFRLTAGNPEGVHE